MTSGRAAALLAWYAGAARDLPWRGERDPYRVLVSEVMLQQTQAGRVADRYPAFVGRFPTAAALAEAPLADVLAAWSGLGYNRRAQRLRDACRVVSREGWPRTAAGLAGLPGVGPYTAAAVACFAFGQQVPALDTNARRVLSRWRGAPLAAGALRDAADAEMAGDARDWNQAVMDLGATVCTSQRPSCPECPVAEWCPGPDSYRPPRRQPAFAGSSRQLRGALVRHLLTGPAAAPDLAAATGFPTDRVKDALTTLTTEGMIATDGTHWHIARA